MDITLQEYDMLRKLLISVLITALVLAFAVGCSSKGSKNDTAAEAASAQTAATQASAAQTTAASEETTQQPEQQEAATVDAKELEAEIEEGDVAREYLENPSTLIEKFSYAMGVYVADVYGTEYATEYYSMFQAYYLPELDPYFGYLGIYDYMTGSLLYTIDELNEIMGEYYDDYDMRMAALADENLAKAEAFLKENTTKEGILTTESGLQYQVVRQGDGALARETDSVELDYELTLMDGTVIDSSYARGEHSTFPLSSVIQGFKEGVMLMPMGSSYVFYIHPSLGYGDQATGSMEPNSLLIFKVETYSIASSSEV